MKKKLIILGCSGFIGKNLAIYFSKKNYNLFGTYNKRKPKLKKIKLFKVDLTSKKNVDKVIKGKDIVIQAAATTSGAKDIISKPYIHVTDNAVMNSLITRSAYDHRVKHIIIFSCTVMYRSSDKPLKEKDFNPNKEMYSKYFGAGWMKVFVEKMSEFYSRLGLNKYTLIRHSNIYGPHDKFDLDKSHVFGATLTKVLKNKKKYISVWGDGSEKRDLLYIDDLIRFVELAIKRQTKKFEIYNVGYGRAITISDLVKKIIKISNKNLKIKYDRKKPTLKTKVSLNCNLAKKDLGWYPKIAINEGIKKTIEWYNKGDYL